jgi:MFS family permease
MREQLRVVITVARDATLARVELAYLGFNMAVFGTWVAILVYAYGLGGAGATAVVALVQLVPSGLVAPFAAYAGDRFPRERVLVAGFLWQAASCAATAVALFGNWSPVLTITFATIASASFTITRPTLFVILPGITHTPGDLTAANAVSGLVENVARFLGPLVGGLVLAAANAGAVFAVFAIVSLGSALLVSRLPTQLQRSATLAGSGVRAILAGSFGGFGILARDRALLLLVTVLSLAVAVNGALDILFVATAIDLLHAGEAWAGYLTAAFGLGGVIGAVATIVLIGRRRMTPALATSGTLLGAPIAAVSVLTSTLLAPLLFAVSGAGYSINAVAGRTLLQRTTPEALLARVFGVVESLGLFALGLGSLAAGIIATTAGTRWGLVVVGLLVPVTLVLVWRKLAALDRDARELDVEALALLRRSAIFAPLSALTIERILAELTRIEVPAGHVLIQQGDPGDRFYVVAEGRVQVIRDGTVVAERTTGDHFGEIALLRDVPRTATVTALTPLRVIAIERDRFLEAVTGHSQSREHVEAIAAERS